MGLVMSNVIRWNHIRENIVDLAMMVNETYDDLLATASSEEGSEDDPSALIFLDVPSFVSFDQEQMKLFTDAMKEADGMNLFILPNEYIRITLSVKDYWEIEHDRYDTNVVELKRNK